MTLIIRTETPTDISNIRSLVEAAFLQAPHTGHNEHLVVDALRAANALSVSLVAELSGQIIGHVALSPVSISDGNPPDSDQRWFGLGPISVLPEFQRQQVGSQLMHRAIEHLVSADATGCVLLGDPGYYSRFGFKVTDKLVLAGVPREYFQSLDLKKNDRRGFVKYHRAFTAEL
jgi:putative acetyltransferase